MFVWRGFKTSVCLTKADALLQVDFSSRVLRQETALNFIDQYCRNDYEELIGKSVMSNYGNYRIYRVDLVEDKCGIDYKFKNKKGEDITIEQYYL